MPQNDSARLQVIGLLGLTLIAFAGNSLLTRAALIDPENGALAFAGVRLVSGAGLLAVVAGIRQRVPKFSGRDIPTILALFTYAVAFSLSYRAITAASGALILFAVVQVSMLSIALLRGVRIGTLGLAGVILALSGLTWLLLPGLQAPPPGASLLMALSGLAWGVYSLLGQGNGAGGNGGGGDPVDRTVRNFLGTVPLVLLIFLFLPPVLTPFGWLMAILSGAVTSALGYLLWYLVLPKLSTPLAASAQLSVPLIAALGGVLLLGEPLSLRFVAAAVLILGGIYLTGRR